MRQPRFLYRVEYTQIPYILILYPVVYGIRVLFKIAADRFRKPLFLKRGNDCRRYVFDYIVFRLI